MSRAPAVSVVLIFYNDERFLPEAIDGVFAQSYEDWELILADDGSTDGSAAIAERCAADHPGRVTYIDHEGHANRGPSATRNLGLGVAAGRYVAVLDSDDVWVPEKLTEQVSVLDTHDEVGLVVGSSLYWWSWAGEAAQRPDRVMPIGAEPDRVHQPPALALQLFPLGKGVSPCPSSWLLRRETIERVGGWEEHLRPVIEDQGLLGKVYLQVPIWVSSKCWDRYRRHPGQLVETIDGPGFRAAHRAYLHWYEEHLAAQGVTDPAIAAAVRRAWWPYRHPHLTRARSFVGRLLHRLRRLIRGLFRSSGQ